MSNSQRSNERRRNGRPLVASFLLSLALPMMLAMMLATVLVEADPVLPRHCKGTVKHVHLAVGRDPTSQMTVSFTSKWAYPDVRAPLGGILYGTSEPDMSSFVAEQEFPLTYNTTLPLERWGHYYAPFQHHFTISDLQPNTTYYFLPVVGSREAGDDALFEHAKHVHNKHHNTQGDADEGSPPENITAENQIINEQQINEQVEGFNRRHRMLTPPAYDGHEKDCVAPHKLRSFRTAPVTDPNMPVAFAIVGDLGQFEHSQYTVRHIRDHKDDYDAAFLIGDIAYTGADERKWETFFDFFDDHSPFDQLPLMIATGNHDIEKQPNGREIFRGYEHRWRMPRVKPAELGVFEGPDGRLNMDAAPYPMPYEWGNAYYSFKYGSAHIIVISAYSNMDPGSTQYDWLVEELHSVDRTITPWLLITMHVPMYNTYDLHHHDLQIVAAREHIQPLLIEHRANMIFSGHIHAYQRTSNIVEDAVKDPRGPVHITIGAGGRACSAPFVNITAEPWIEQRDATMYGYGKFHIYNSTDAAWVWIPTIESDRHSFNYVKKRDDVHIPSVKDDGAWIKNQYFLN